jgi:hypothetical protein
MLAPSVATFPNQVFPLYPFNWIMPLAYTSIDGIPETSLTEKIVPERSLVIENNCPALPSKETVPLDSGYTRKVISVLDAVLPLLNEMFGLSVADARFGVMIRSL